MVGRDATGRRRKTLWSQTGPSGRLAFGAAVISVVSLIGLTPRSLLGVEIPWPYAALWGAIGWARVGLSIRPILILSIFGVMQDIITNAPMGVFATINLTVYGLSALIARHTDGMKDAAVAVLAPAVLLLLAFMAVWSFASLTGGRSVPAGPIFTVMLVTGGIYALTAEIFNLGRRPGEAPGASS